MLIIENEEIAEGLRIFMKQIIKATLSGQPKEVGIPQKLLEALNNNHVPMNDRILCECILNTTKGLCMEYKGLCEAFDRINLKIQLSLNDLISIQNKSEQDLYFLDKDNNGNYQEMLNDICNVRKMLTKASTPTQVFLYLDKLEQRIKINYQKKKEPHPKTKPNSLDMILHNRRAIDSLKGLYSGAIDRLEKILFPVVTLWLIAEGLELSKRYTLPIPTNLTSYQWAIDSTNKLLYSLEPGTLEKLKNTPLYDTMVCYIKTPLKTTKGIMSERFLKLIRGFLVFNQPFYTTPNQEYIYSQIDSFRKIFEEELRRYHG